ncbi:MAG: hypothetical protein H7Y19_03060 [Luteimonas sp.]|nr:hypothetical protein [Luteimonas sp.]
MKLRLSAIVATLGLVAASQARAQVLQLRGSDTLENVTRDVITSCGLNASINYRGGGSSGGENAMKGATPLQQIAPMSRELNNRVPGDECVNSSSQLLIGLDSLAIVAANQTDGDSLEKNPGIFQLLGQSGHHSGAECTGLRRQPQQRMRRVRQLHLRQPYHPDLARRTSHGLWWPESADRTLASPSGRIQR